MSKDDHTIPTNPMGQGSVSTRIITWVARAVLISVGLVIIAMTASICYEVVCRSVFNVPVIWVDEVTGYLMGYIAFVGAGAALYDGAHVGVDLLLARVSGTAAKVLRLIAECVMLTLAIVFLYLSGSFWFDALSSSERSGTLLGISLWIPYLSLFIGSGLLLVVQLAHVAIAWSDLSADDSAEKVAPQWD